MSDYKALEAPAAGSPKHTPGPWSFGGAITGPNAAYFIDNDGERPFDCVRSGNRCIAYVPLAEPGSLADAKLLVAAPALADALEAALAAIRALRGLAFTGSRIPTERYPEKAQADAADETARAALRAAGRLP